MKYLDWAILTRTLTSVVLTTVCDLVEANLHLFNCLVSVHNNPGVTSGLSQAFNTPSAREGLKLVGLVLTLGSLSLLC